MDSIVYISFIIGGLGSVLTLQSVFSEGPYWSYIKVRGSIEGNFFKLIWGFFKTQLILLSFFIPILVFACFYLF
jgi:hypothetical protein